MSIVFFFSKNRTNLCVKINNYSPTVLKDEQQSATFYFFLWGARNKEKHNNNDIQKVIFCKKS